MTINHLNLDEQEVPDKPSCTFTLDTTEWKCRDGQDVSWELVSSLYRAAEENGDYMAKVGEFFRAVIVPDQWEAFNDLMKKPDTPFTVRRAEALVPFLMEHVMGVPTEPSKPARSGRQRTASKSKARSSAPATRRKAS